MLQVFLLLTLVAWLAFTGWSWWYRRTFAARSTETMLRAWHTMGAIHAGGRFDGRTSQLVYYRCKHSWRDGRANFVLLACSDSGQWFEASVKVFGVHSVSPLVIERVLSDVDAQAWLADRRAYAQIDHFFPGLQPA